MTEGLVAARNAFWGRAFGLALLLAVLAVWFWIEATPPPRAAPPAGQVIAIDKTPQAQSERKAVIDKLVADGLVRRIEPEHGGTLKASLRPAFYLMDPETRARYVDVIYRYYFDGTSVNDVVTLRDARNGNEVGQYNPYKGGLNLYNK